MKRGKKRIIGLVIFAVAVALIAGYIKFFNGTFLYISTGLKDDVVLKAGNSKAYTWEADILLSAVCGVRAWKVSTWMTM